MEQSERRCRVRSLIACPNADGESASGHCRLPAMYWLPAATGNSTRELCGLQWDEMKDGYVEVRRGFWGGKQQVTKNTKHNAFAISAEL